MRVFSLVQCLDILSKQADNPQFGDILAEIRGEMEGGAHLADAMGQHPKVFKRALLQHDRGGEAGGIPRHHPAAFGVVHREVRAAETRGEIRLDLSGRHRLGRVLRRAGYSLEGHPDLCHVCLPAWARNCRCLRASS